MSIILCFALLPNVFVLFTWIYAIDLISIFQICAVCVRVTWRKVGDPFVSNCAVASSYTVASSCAVASNCAVASSCAVADPQEKIPVKWMALEQLSVAEGEKRKYDQKTDVWSFGVTSWEVFSKGKTRICNVVFILPFYLGRSCFYNKYKAPDW